MKVSTIMGLTILLAACIAFGIIIFIEIAPLL